MKTKESKGKLHFAWIILIGICIVNFITQGLLLGTIGVYMTPISESLNVGQTNVSLIMTIEMLGMMVAMPFAGGMLKKVPIKVLLPVSTCAVAVMLVLASFAQSISVLYIAWFVIGVSVSVNLLMGTLNGNWFVDKLGTATGISVAVSSLGGSIFNPIVSLMVNSSGWRMGYRMTALIIAIILIPLGLFVLRYAPGEGEEPYGIEKVKARAAAGETVVGSGAEDGLTLKEAAKTSFFYVAILSGAVFGTISSLAQQIIPHLTSKGMEPTVAATALSVILATAAVAKLLMGSLLDSRHRNLVLYGCAISSLIGWLLIANAPSTALVFAGCVLGGVATSIGLVGIPYMTRRAFGGKEFGKLSGISGVVSTLFPAIGIVLSAMVFDKTGSYTPVFSLVAVLVIILTFLCVTGYDRFMKYRAESEKQNERNN